MNRHLPNLQLFLVAAIAFQMLAGCQAPEVAQPPAQPPAEREPGQLPPTHALVTRAEGKITIDGKLDEQAWKKAQPLPVDMVHTKLIRTDPAGVFRMTWDDENFYIGFRVPDDDIQALGAEHDKCDIVPPRDVIEVFIDINGDSHHFFELHLNALNGFNDIFIIRPPEDSPLRARTRYGLMFIKGWDMAEYETAVSVDGTLNDDKPDRAWYGEMRLPFKSLLMPVGKKHPAPGDTWRVQLVVQDGDVKDRRYMAWSPTTEPWFHHGIETWGRVEFAK